ncbi:MAG TPA: metallophosphoesterase [Verrucomicrobiota bacterium]|nr:metallophosphoesterase [Verrucomicrobiota bacterium]HOK78088.1 metallophosphoesterase [Verrucomicrobiota bacterium]
MTLRIILSITLGLIAAVLSTPAPAASEFSPQPKLLSVSGANGTPDRSCIATPASAKSKPEYQNLDTDSTAARFQTVGRPRIARANIADGSTILEIEADTNFACRVETSTNLIDWENAGWVDGLRNGLFSFADHSRASHPMRFYRAVLVEIPSVRIAVLSDPHYMHPSLLISDGPAFQNYLLYDPKLLCQSAAILDSAIAGITNARPDLVLIPGDLTKDGELVSHQSAAEVLRRLRDAGIKVFVCPGNHDVANPEAVAFDGATVAPVPSVTPEEFAGIYADFGYGNASIRDPNSLSYVAEPVPGLLILAMDACRYDRNTNNRSFVGGYFDAARWDWITNQLDRARAQGKLLIGMMHHGVTEHYLGQKTFFPEYVVDDYESVRETFARYRMRVVFTGHYHAHDIVQFDSPAGKLFDIETGSLLTYPCPYRVVDLAVNGWLAIKSQFVTNIDYDLGGVAFPNYAYSYITNGTMNYSVYLLTQPPYNLPPTAAQQFAPPLTEAFLSHCIGDESSRSISPQTQGLIAFLLEQEDPMAQLMANALLALFNDPEPADNDLSINLLTGEVAP